MVADPKELVAVRVYVVVAVGLTTTDVPVTVPTPELTLRVGAPVTTQLKVLDWPEVMLAGEALKLVIVGALPTVTVRLEVTEPNVLVADRV